MALAFLKVEIKKIEKNKCVMKEGTKNRKVLKSFKVLRDGYCYRV